MAFEELQRDRVRDLGRRRRGLEERRDERPAARARGRPEPREPARDADGRGADRRADARRGDAQRPERVVGDLAGPHEVPQRGEQHRFVGGARRGDEVGPERRARARELRADRVVHGPVGRLGQHHRRREQLDAVAEEEAHPAVVGAERARAGPHQLAGRAELVEHRGPVALDARGQHVALEHRHRDRDALELLDRLDERVGAAPAAADALPRGEEPHERGGVDRLDLVAQRGERAAPQRAEHARVAPLALAAAGPELAVHDPARRPRAGRAPRARARR